MTRVWQSSRGKQIAVTVKSEDEEEDFDPTPQYQDDYGKADIDRTYAFLEHIGYRLVWNLRVGVDIFNSYWRNKTNGRFLLVQWYRDSGAVEVLLPVDGQTLEEVYEKIEVFNGSAQN